MLLKIKKFTDASLHNSQLHPRYAKACYSLPLGSPISARELQRKAVQKSYATTNQISQIFSSFFDPYSFKLQLLQQPDGDETEHSLELSYRPHFLKLFGNGLGTRM